MAETKPLLSTSPKPKNYVPTYFGQSDEERVALGEYAPLPATDEEMRAENLRRQIAFQKQKNELIYGLPHRYGWKWYVWAREFFESRNHLNFLCAANQISKSSTQIRKCIEWATNKALWPQLWDREPNLFWYLYPERSVATAEFKLKWVREFLPRGEFKDDPVYGWREFYKRGEIDYIEFNSGVSVYFKTYAQDTQHLQTGTVYAIFCDEELPEEYYPELDARLNASKGYFHMVFTATLGQDFWRRCIEPDEGDEVVFPQAAKWTASLYDSMYYEDGTPSHWTADKIAFVKAKCKSHDEVQKRIYGKFIVLSDRIYPHFSAVKHVKRAHPIPPSWLWYAGADPGSGGAHGHPAALCYVAVSPDYRQGRVVFGWRGDKIETTNDFVVRKHIELKSKYKISPELQFYDWANKDFQLTARGLGETFLKADKSHDTGEGLLNTLFENDMLIIYEDEDGELSKLCRELSSLKKKTLKKHAKDDFCDALRYAVSRIPWDLSGIVGKKSEYVEPEKPEDDPEKLQMMERRGMTFGHVEKKDEVQAEFDEWNAFAEG